MRDYLYYLFDADGTLFDTTELICDCFKHSAVVAGKSGLDTSTIISNIGMTLRKQMDLHFGPLTDEQFEVLRKSHMEYQRAQYHKYLKLCPGVMEALNCLKDNGKRCAVVTSRFKESLGLYLQKTGIIDMFEFFVTPETTQNHKPHPEPALKALELLSGNSREAVFIGDSRFDIECGAGAGTDTAFVNWSLSGISPLDVQPTYYLNDMRDLCVNRKTP